MLLVEGATAGGKTAVYAEALRAALAAGRGGIVLVPEIALALPLLERLAHDLPVEVAVLHSGLSEGERADEWRRIRKGEARIVVGTRLAVLAPLANPGVVIVDEEHDASYKSDRTPRYQARDVALELGRLAGVPVILGSATPDVASVGRARAGEYERFVLPERIAGAPPRVEIVDLRAELAAGNKGLLSEPLVDALAALDRSAGDRGHPRYQPPRQRVGGRLPRLRIRPDLSRVPASARFPCRGDGAALSPLRRDGTGRAALPGVRLAAHPLPRWRHGTGRARGPAALPGAPRGPAGPRRGRAARRGGACRGRIHNGDLDVLVGTSLAAKGLDVPQVTLVGVVSADIALNLPDERAAERTYQLLAQAVGRAGRGERPGRALIQTYQPEHPAIRAVVEGAAEFYDAELESRRRFGSPPFGRLIKLTVSLEDRAAAEKEGVAMAGRLRDKSAAQRAGVEVLGPVPAYVARRAGKWRFHVVLRGAHPLAVLGGDPGVRWSVDVDPESRCSSGQAIPSPAFALDEGCW